jgi:hypothetical protein
MKKILFLLSLPFLLAACTKDSKPTLTFTGIVLDPINHIPVINANVGISLIVQGNGRPAPVTVTATTITNARGEYTMVVDGGYMVLEYYTPTWKKGMVQTRNGFHHTVVDQVPDTLFLDKASYLKIDVKINTIPTQQGTMQLSWDYLKPADPAYIVSAFYKTQDFLNVFPGATYKIVDSFSYYDHQRMFTGLSLSTSTDAKQLSGKDWPLLKQDTNYIKFEY